jgi:hypothetical protein
MCDVSFDGDFDTQVARERVVKAARKKCRCSACGAQIQVGEGYVYVFSVYDHRPDVQRCCMACEAVRQLFNEQHRCIVSPEGLFQFLQECYRETEEGAQWKPHIDALLQRNAEAIAACD